MHCGYCQILVVLRPVGTASAGTASTASARSSSKIRSISTAYWEYEIYFNHLSVHHRFDNFIRILLQTALTVHGWSHEWELKQTTFGVGTRLPRVLAVFRDYMLRALDVFTGSTLLSPEHSSHFGCLYCGECLYSGFCTSHHTPSRSIWAFSSLAAHAPSTRSI